MAAMRSSCCLIIISLLVLGSLSAFARMYVKPMDVNDPHVVEIANFAITEHNHKSNANLKLVKIESCNRQVHGVLGNSYQLVLLASNETTEETNKYWVRLGIQPSEKYVLGSFILAPSLYH
ncbi:cysteine proteinase inhibitor 5 [Arachis duranensis]|uniref:Cysteine proteinase inhibitor 5 n=1 Tax=Arachis duranensis TaxID=130453 RepID=A0A9C6TGY5_ARADU|nr:cysteine proteinase inhibitor 5 [Arachis duranensis]